MYTKCTPMYTNVHQCTRHLKSMYKYVHWCTFIFFKLPMKQVRLSKWNVETLESLGFLTSDEMNLYISSILNSDVHQCTPEKQPTDFSSLLPFLSSIQDSLQSIACASGRVWQRTLSESFEKEPSLSDLFKVGEHIKLPKNIQWTGALTLGEQYWRSKTPKERPLSDKQQQWVGDLCNKTINGISSDWDWESSSGSTRNVSLVYGSLWWPVDLYDQYVRIMQEWLLDNWGHKAELFKF